MTRTHASVGRRRGSGYLGPAKFNDPVAQSLYGSGLSCLKVNRAATCDAGSLNCFGVIGKITGTIAHPRRTMKSQSLRSLGDSGPLRNDGDLAVLHVHRTHPPWFTCMGVAFFKPYVDTPLLEFVRDNTQALCFFSSRLCT